MPPKTWNKRNKKVYLSELVTKQSPVIGFNTITNDYINGLIIEPYTIVNLLGSYGSFSTDSNGDGIADGWSIVNSHLLEAKTVSSGIQYYKRTSQASTSSWVYLEYPRVQAIPTNNTDKWFFKARAKVRTTASTTIDTLRGLYLIGIDSSGNDIWESGGYFSLLFPQNSDFQVVYTSSVFSNTKVVKIVPMGFYVENSYLPVGAVNEVWVDYIEAVNLTAMGYLPNSLKQFFSPTPNITKWEDLATTNQITAIDGTVKSGNDWLDMLIPYVDSVATIGGYWDAANKQFVTTTQKFEIKRNLIDFGKEFVTSVISGSGIWHDSRTLEAYNGMPYGANGYQIFFNTIPVLKEKTYKYKLKGIHVNNHWNNQAVCYFLNWGVGDKGQIRHPKNEEVKSYTNTDSFYRRVYLDFFLTHGIIKQAKLWLDGYEEPFDEEKRTIVFEQLQNVFPLIGFNNVFDRLHITGKKIIVNKFWKTIDTTTNSSGNVTLSDMVSNTTCIVINKNNGEVKILTASGQTVSTGWNNTNVTIIYRISLQTYTLKPVLDSSTNLRYLKGLGMFLMSYKVDTYRYKIDTITVNQSDEIYINGVRVPNEYYFSGTIDKYAKYGDEIIVLRPRNDYVIYPILLETLSQSNTEKEILFIENVDVSEETDFIDIEKLFVTGFEKINNVYKINLSIGVLEGSKTFYEQYKDKTFQLKIFDSSINKNVIFTPCKILEPSSVNVLDGTEEVTIIALKKIEEV